MKNVKAVADFVLDFESTDFETDSLAAKAYFSSLQHDYKLEDQAFALEEPKGDSMGWYFAKLFLSLEFVQKLYDNNSYAINLAKGLTVTDKFLPWLESELGKKGCRALLKYANEMRDYGRYSAGVPIAFEIS